MTLTYVCTLDLPTEWFDALARRVPGLDLHRFGSGTEPSAEVLERTDLLHTSSWLPDAAQVPNLRAIQLDTSGVDHVRGTALWDTEIPIATLGGIAPVPMAEYAMMSMLELAHRMPLIERLRATRTWPGDAERLATLTPRSLVGATVGIIGYGRIGREISRLAGAFGMRVLGLKRTAARSDGTAKFDTGRSSADADTTEIFPMERLHEVLAQSDVLVVVVPLTELTRGMIGDAELALLPPGAFVVNIARGGIVDEDALLGRLRSGEIGGAALDVFDDEPLPPDSPWWSEPGVLVTPHVAGLAPEYQSQTLDLVVENLNRLADGRPLLNEVDRVSGY
ncbi:2-hydroxyacid dehydrogenase [Agromyces rhizosphaerae]|uniref:2-hydroxyacid dehydrogenase n=1 Tax=Agromyces rhizosphaerae TaxID=88374 RepID=A0A9W6CU82_9MICO|nr:D-2-hydroxyacid dehydrogenase [Agromyces rhizosphaerae]GLI26485.1 2-hydroxyacid dehydrogenase [Agromyces rhizosphaerae]